MAVDKVNSFGGDITNIHNWINKVNEILDISIAIEIQDEHDRNSIALIGLKEGNSTINTYER